MTREKKKRLIRHLKYNLEVGADYLIADEDVVEIIKALEQEPCENVVNRQAAIEAVIDLCKHYTPTKSVHHPHVDFVIEALQDLPPVNPQPRTGHWEWVRYDSNPNIGNWQCSECRCVVIECGDKKSKGDIPLYKYCPQCGCRIVEPQESEGEE